MSHPRQYLTHRLSIFDHYVQAMQTACARTSGKAVFLGADPVTESLGVQVHSVRSLFRSPESANGFVFATRDFVIGFYSSAVYPWPQHLQVHFPRDLWAHPNSDGTNVCIGEARPKIIPADLLLLHVYRILTFQKYNVLSAVDGRVAAFIARQPSGVFPTDTTPLYSLERRQ